MKDVHLHRKYFGFLVRTAESIMILVWRCQHSKKVECARDLAQDDRWMPLCIILGLLVQLHATNIPGFQNHAFPHDPL